MTHTSTEAPAKFVCACNEPFETWVLLGQHQIGTGHTGCAADPDHSLEDDDALNESEVTVDGQRAKVIHARDQVLPVEPMTLANALEQLDLARERHAKYKLALADAKGFEKDAQAWVNTCVEQLCEVARRESEPELPFENHVAQGDSHEV